LNLRDCRFAATIFRNVRCPLEVRHNLFLTFEEGPLNNVLNIPAAAQALESKMAVNEFEFKVDHHR